MRCGHGKYCRSGRCSARAFKQAQTAWHISSTRTHLADVIDVIFCSRDGRVERNCRSTRSVFKASTGHVARRLGEPVAQFADSACEHGRCHYEHFGVVAHRSAESWLADGGEEITAASWKRSDSRIAAVPSRYRLSFVESVFVEDRYFGVESRWLRRLFMQRRSYPH